MEESYINIRVNAKVHAKVRKHIKKTGHRLGSFFELAVNEKIERDSRDISIAKAALLKAEAIKKYGTP